MKKLHSTVSNLGFVLLSSTSVLTTAQTSDVVKKDAINPSVSSPSPTVHWYDGSAKRAVSIDSTRVVRFGSDGTSEIMPAALFQTKAAVTDFSSPLIMDGGRKRALPGGMVVTLQNARDEADARAQLAAVGLKVVRAISGSEPSIGATPLGWLVASPAGLASLTQANQLHESGRFASVQPNWWTERTKK
jgi:hypothetical protein